MQKKFRAYSVVVHKVFGQILAVPTILKLSLKIFLLFFWLLTGSSCRYAKEITSSGSVINLDTIVVSATEGPPVYNASRPRLNDLIHTKLDVKFNWEKQYLYAKATLILKPYFYPQSTLDLDAKGFDLKRILLLKEKNPQTVDSTELKYSYDGNAIHIFLDKEYSRHDTFCIYIDYTAKPEEREIKGSAAITEDKGLYFINPDGKETGKPRQIWTQGETEASSCWFPTIDSPNEKMTQEISITVDKNFLTLSNGLLVYQMENSDGTRTDVWKQELPHSPYLTMMAIGEYVVIKDSWREKEVNYYVEKEYEKEAKKIFGNTPEMLEFFSDKLGVDYPWSKFSQVVVRDYVSGAMENTTVVVHGEFMQQSERELLDNDFEDVISHELFHHWFGDLVTCESWANLPLNESFATLGEYLWIENKYGRQEADYHLQQDFSAYFAESSRKKEELIRFDYDDKEDMFDRHSYQKGGAVLNMLRNLIGEEAFFEALKIYLEKFKFKTAEIHDLRLVFEEVTGQDLNWFFNQWFLHAGHPQLTISYEFIDSLKQQKIIIEQTQDLSENPLYRLPLNIDIYSKGNVEKQKVTVSKQREEFIFYVFAKPDLVNVDADKKLLAQKKDGKTASEWVFQYYNAPLYLDRYESVIQCAAHSRLDSMAPLVVIDALSDKQWNIRATAVRSLDFLPTGFAGVIKEKLMKIALADIKSTVRAAAIRELQKNYKGDEAMAIFKKALDDPSLVVMGDALSAIAENNIEEAMKLAKSIENQSENLNTSIMATIAGIYAQKGGDAESGFFERYYDKSRGYGKIGFVVSYEKFLKNEQLSEQTISTGLGILKKIVESDNTFYIRLYGIQALKNLENEFDKREMIISDKIEKESNKMGPDELKSFTLRRDAVLSLKKKAGAQLEDLKKLEKEELNFHNH